MKQIIIITTLALASFVSNAQTLKDIFISKDLSQLKSYVANKGVNTPERGYYPIVVAAKMGDLETMRYLLDKGADINARGHQKRTALMYAAQHNHIAIGKMLIQKRANLIYKDISGMTAFDIAIKSGNRDFAEEVIKKNLHLYAGADGPYIFEEGGNYKAYYVLPQGGKMNSNIETIGHNSISSHDFHCHNDDGRTIFSFNVNENEHIYPDSYDDNEPVFAMSDIEGNLPALVDLLKAGNVMNDRYQWTFGKGHLVLVGDFFDRGDQVTECLWLIYKLEQEARAQGGNVHFIIGNHELMNLSGDIRFVRTKYKSNARLMGKSYHDMYGENTILGRWLRTKPAMLRIRDMVFVHAGLSPTFIKYKLDMATINETTMISIDVPQERWDAVTSKVLGKEGPLWYRGVARGKVTATDVEACLSYYSSSTLIIGHTKVDDIITSYGGRVINLDVHHEDGSQYQQALMVSSGSYYSVDTSGRKTKIK